jgi:hypothetical protein
MGLAYHIAFGLSFFWVNVNTTLICKERELGSATKVALVPKPLNLGKEIYQQQMWGPKYEVWISQVLNVL